MILFNYPKKSLGQNFLIDENIIKKIIAIGEINRDKTVLEIGPGTGRLTDEIMNFKPKKIIIVEKDKNLSIKLKEKSNNFKNLKVVNADILNFISGEIEDKKVVVYGNLPYNISTQILARLILLNKWPPWYSKLILMFQKEVADRIIAKDNSKNFSRLTVLSNWRLQIKKHFDVSKNCFFPKPKINSTVLSFEPKIENKFNIKNPKSLEMVTRVLFSSPRKMINKNLIKLFKKEISSVNKLNLKLNQRPKELNCETYYKITEKYERLFK